MLFDLTITITRIYALLITSSLFAIYFLGLRKYRKIFNLYKFIIVISILAIFFLDNSEKFGMTLALILMLFLAIYNLFVGIYTYLQGEKQARLYILGFGIVFVSYLLIISDILGFISMTQEYPNTLLFTTAFEALILSLAFADRYIILENEKKCVDVLLLEEANNREGLIQKEVLVKTEQLQQTVQEKELLLQEVHHRVKNNLQIILSMVELQKEKEESHLLDDLENRINAIAKTYEMLISNDTLEKINMKAYINVLLADIKETFSYLKHEIKIQSKVEATLTLKEAIYIGLIINELVTNAYKYAFDTIGVIYVELVEEKNAYNLLIKDTGKGFELKESSESFGLELVKTLVLDQLHGKLQMNTQKSEYLIEFSPQ
jgi:two-component sensor histidine kinase